MWIKCLHQEAPKTLSVKVELGPGLDYEIKSAKVRELIGVGDESTEEEFGADDFSKKIEEHGFEEVEVRMKIEEEIEGLEVEKEIL